MPRTGASLKMGHRVSAGLGWTMSKAPSADSIDSIAARRSPSGVADIGIWSCG